MYQWNYNSECLDLSSLPNIKKINKSIPLTKKSQLSLISVGKLNIELFLSRDEISKNPLFSSFHASFSEAYNNVPEYLAAVLISESKYFSLLVDNKSIIDELLISLVIKTYENNVIAFKELLKLVSKQKVIEVSRGIIASQNAQTINLVQALHDLGILDEVFEKLPIRDSLKLSPTAMPVSYTHLDVYKRQTRYYAKM